MPQESKKKLILKRKRAQKQIYKREPIAYKSQDIYTINLTNFNRLRVSLLMSSEKKSPKIDCKLDSNNYNLWNFQMKSLLVDQSCVLTDAEPVPGCHPLRLDDANPRSSLCIIQNCSQEINVNLMQYTTANEMWDFLYQTYSGQNSARKLTGIKKLATLKYAPGSLEENLNRMQIILVDTITAAGSQPGKPFGLCWNGYRNFCIKMFSWTKKRSLLDL